MDKYYWWRIAYVGDNPAAIQCSRTQKQIAEMIAKSDKQIISVINEDLQDLKI